MKTKITYTELIQWLTVQAQMEAKNWSKEFKNSVELYYDLMHQDNIVALADLNGFEVIEAVLDTNTIDTEQAKPEPKAINGDPLVKESEIKAMLEKAFPNAVVISHSDLKAMGSDIESLMPLKAHSLDELVEGLGLKDLLADEYSEGINLSDIAKDANTINTDTDTDTDTETCNQYCEYCKEELLESEAFVSSFVEFFEVEKEAPGMKQVQTNLILDIANCLLTSNNAVRLNQLVVELPMIYSMYVIKNSTDFKQTMLDIFKAANVLNLSEGTSVELNQQLNRLLSTLSLEQIKQIKKNITIKLMNLVK